jgi:hypothetical protein
VGRGARAGYGPPLIHTYYIIIFAVELASFDEGRKSKK